MIAEIKIDVLESWQIMSPFITVYDENHTEIKMVKSIDFDTGEIVRNVLDGDGFKEAKTIHNKFSIEYNRL